MSTEADLIQAQIDAIVSALSRGVLRVRHGETETTYFTPAQMREALAVLEAKLAGAQTTPVRQVRFMTSKGLD
jgi:hypothetical protein